VPLEYAPWIVTSHQYHWFLTALALEVVPPVQLFAAQVAQLLPSTPPVDELIIQQTVLVGG
jgi:hypothetical protein